MRILVFLVKLDNLLQIGNLRTFKNVLSEDLFKIPFTASSKLDS